MKKTALFDFDGVIMDTEPQYTKFWEQVGKDYLCRDGMGKEVKGQTLTYIFNTYLPNQQHAWQEITDSLNSYEQHMDYVYVPGAVEFVADLRRNGINTAVVTSSNEKKMQAVYAMHPEVLTMFDRMLTAEMFTRSKPAPDCFLLGMEVFGSKPEDTFVFEDSFNGLKAAKASGGFVVGLTTSNCRESIATYCNHIIDDFTDMTCDKLLKLRRESI